MSIDINTIWVYYTDMVRGILCKKRILTVFLASMLAISSIPIKSSAISDKEREEFKQQIIDASVLLQKAITSSKKEAEEKLKKTIMEEGLDYQLTMLSYENQIDPYKETDYNELIFSYATAKEYSNKPDTLYNLPFYNIKVTKESVEQYVPKLVQTYKELGDGTYELGDKVYIDKPTKIITARKIPGTQIYEKTGEKEVTPEYGQIEYGVVTVEGLGSKEILSHYGLSDNKDAENAYLKKYKQAELIVSGAGLAQTYNIQMPSIVSISADAERQTEKVFEDTEVSGNRKTLLSVAKALAGKVPYEWGGKAIKEGYDTTWWTIKENGQQKGLDCSGFVQWAFRTCGIKEWNLLHSTKEILKNTETIGYSELVPGDLGLLNNGQSLNHVGIYFGDGYWIHCSSGKGTVVIEKTDMFSIFKRMPGEAEQLPELVEEEIDYEPHLLHRVGEDGEETEYTHDEIYLLAQLIFHEAHTEGLNGWIAVAEVVKNRMLSSEFPQTIEEVVFQDGQFAGNSEIRSMEPTAEEIEVAKQVLAGNMQVLGNEKILFFRNANGSKENWGPYRWYMEINHHEFYFGKET